MSNKFKVVRDTEKYKYWQLHVRAWEQSGLEQIEYCRRNELSIKVFGYWKRKLLSETEGVSFVPVSIKPTYTAHAMPAATLKVVTGNGYGVEVGDGFNPATLRMLLEVIGKGS